MCTNSQFVTLQITTSTATIILGNCKASGLKWTFCLLPSFLLHTHTRIFPVWFCLFTRSNCSWPWGHRGRRAARDIFAPFGTLPWFSHSPFEKKHYYSTPFRKYSSSSRAQVRPYSALSRGSISCVCLGAHHPLLGSGLKFSPTPSTAPPQTTSGSLGKFTLNLTDFHPCPKDKEKWTFKRSLAIFPRELNHYEKLRLSKSEPCNK